MDVPTVSTPKETQHVRIFDLIHDDEQALQRADPEVYERTAGEHREFVAANQNHVRGGNRLRLSSTATSIRRNAEGDVIVTDGAFAESKEVLTARWDDAFLQFEVKRHLGWPGEAPSYKVGGRIWLEAREEAKARKGSDFDLKVFHRAALDLGSFGLDPLRAALARI